MADAVGGAGGDADAERGRHLATAEDMGGKVFDWVSYCYILLVNN